MGLLLAQSGKVSANGLPHRMPVAYWDDVAYCETHGNWIDGGAYAGGLGIAQTSWENYGGREFSRTPKGATKEEQLEVAYRISVAGYQTKHVYLTLDDKLNNKPFFRPAAGFFGWGCIRAHQSLHPQNWLRNHRRKKP